jgi:mannose-binding lectin 2
MAIMGDGQTKYDMAHDGDSQALGACSVRVLSLPAIPTHTHSCAQGNIRRTNVATKIKITFLKDEYVDVALQYKAWDEWTHCFRIDKVALPISPFIGFSAITGDVHDAHE